MKAISVKYVGSRWKNDLKLVASCYEGDVTISYDPFLDDYENMLLGAIELCKKYSLDFNKLNACGILDNYTMVFTFIDGLETLESTRKQLIAKDLLKAS